MIRSLASTRLTHQLGQNTQLVTRAAERLSSGLRINRSADDAGGLSLSQTMWAQVRGTQQAIANMQDAVHFVRIAEDGLNEVLDILQRMRVLTLQATNGTMTPADQASVEAEWDQMANGLLDARTVAAAARLDFAAPPGQRRIIVQAGANGGETYTVDYEALRTEFVSMTAGALTMASNDPLALSFIDARISGIANQTAALGAHEATLSHMLNTASVRHETLSSALSRLRDADVAAEMTAHTAGQLRTRAGVQVLRSVRLTATSLTRSVFQASPGA